MMRIYCVKPKKINGFKNVWFFRNIKKFFVTYFLIYLFF
jgi:hypothetical protein